MGSIRFLKCRECGAEYTPVFKYICEECFGPLDVIYDVPKDLNRDTFSSRSDKTYWRYFELLPIADKDCIVNIHAGFTPLQYAEELGTQIGNLKNLFIKNDSVNPTFSFKDRPAGVAISKSREFKLKAVGCASTGNLASATAAHAAKARLPCFIFAPSDIGKVKIAQALSYGAKFVAVEGTYDDANRVASIIGIQGIGIVNINMRPYYVEGSKTLAYEVAEQLNWNVPDHLIIPVGSGAMLNAICKGFEELHDIGLIGDISNLKVTAAQPHGCAPIVDAFKKNASDIVPIERPETIAKSLAIGESGDGVYVLRRLKQYGGVAEEANDNEIIEGILTLAKTEGIFTEPAGGVSVAVLKKLVDDGFIERNEKVVCYVTGNGLKSTEAIMSALPKLDIVSPDVQTVSAMISWKG